MARRCYYRFERKKFYSIKLNYAVYYYELNLHGDVIGIVGNENN